MTIHGKLAVTEYALKKIIAIREGGSWVELDRAIEGAKIVYADVRGPAVLKELWPMISERKVV